MIGSGPLGLTPASTVIMSYTIPVKIQNDFCILSIEMCHPVYSDASGLHMSEERVSLTSLKGVASSCLLLTAWMSSLLHITRPHHHWIFQWKHLKSYSIAIFYSHCLDIFCTVFAKIEHCQVFYTVPLTVMASWLLSRSYRIEHFLFLLFFISPFYIFILYV